ncbi:MAG: FAD-binding oxidoreductase [Acidobacteria bacterium ACB1]|nr:putative FAD-linked oxidoreductase [Pyrinomonadaceae bacterium]MCE7961249.1 FAD-binding oxidoreductase [Acidobacteria bacterium ACB1]RIJ93473.1 MAG: FAD-binding oxidoreductase [Acidobacteriota bacterium]
MHAKTQTEDLQNYLTDASNMPGGSAERLFVPETSEQVAEILREANANGTPVTVSGARTGTVGGAIPFGGTVVSLEKLNAIAIDPENRTATVGPGVVLGDFQKEVERVGRFYPPDPTEWSCQIGGTVATNASGARSFKYGATREYVRGLRIALADGDFLSIRRGEAIAVDSVLRVVTENGRAIDIRVPTYQRPNVRKNVSGYFNSDNLDAIDLFIGSEGTLGVVVEATLSLLEKPKGFFSGIVFFEKAKDLLAFVDEARERSRTPGSDIEAVLLEYFDANSLAFIGEKFPETPSGMAGAIFFEQETTSENEDALLSAWNELLEKHNAAQDASWFTTNEQDLAKMREFRHSLPVSVNERVVKNKQKKIGTDMAVPDDKFEGFLRFYKETLDASGIEYVIFGHIGDAHLHANLLPKTEDEATRSRHIYGRCIAQAIMLGGCVSAEHGIGKLKRKYLAAMMGERYLNEMAEVKRALDPRGILGRGNMFGEGFLTA